MTADPGRAQTRRGTKKILIVSFFNALPEKNIEFIKLL